MMYWRSGTDGYPPVPCDREHSFSNIVIGTRCCFVKKPVACQDYVDGMDENEKGVMVKLIAEVVIDATQKISQLDQLKEDHCKYLAFEAGWIIGIIREKYRLMLELYREAHSKQTDRNHFHGINISQFSPLYLGLAMERVRIIELEIDQIVNMIDKLPKKFYVIESKKAGRMGPDTEEALVSNIVYNLEKEVKTQNKKQYFLQKMGLSSNDSLKAGPLVGDILRPRKKDVDFYEYDLYDT